MNLLIQQTRRTPLFLVALSWFVFSPAASAGNLLANAGFETGSLAGWSTSGVDEAVTKAEAHIGS